MTEYRPRPGGYFNVPAQDKVRGGRSQGFLHGSSSSLGEDAYLVESSMSRSELPRTVAVRAILGSC